ncbi:peptidase [Streptomyces sp. CAU 1734]|uniref:peptidase n=1 Tax=Streptomyces sp. CAU 1734 TaxID=3140360 RepID=UPI003261C630
MSVSVLVAAACAGVLMSPSPAGAARIPEGGSGARAASGAVDDPGAAFWAKHERVGEVADALVAASRKQARQGGYAGLVTAPEKSSITLYWKGRVPAQVRAAMKSDRRVAVRTVSAPYTEHQLKAARDRVVRQRAALPGRLTSAGPSPDGKGLLIGMAPERGKTAAARKAAIARDVTGITGGVAVAAVSYSSPAPAVGKASDDTAPAGVRATGRNAQQAYGGAKWQTRSGGSCSTGFSVRYSGSTTNRMTSAAHCGSVGGAAHSPERPSSYPFGRIETLRHNRDVGVMKAEQNGANSFFQPAIWWGPWVGNPSGQTTRRVAGVHNNHVGQHVCGSGAPSGTTCGIRIDATGQTIRLNGFPDVEQAVQVSKPTGQPVWGNGDSGGPVVQPSSLGVAYANGIISALSSSSSNSAPCQGAPAAGSRKCSSVGWYAAFDSFLSYEGLNLLTQ